MSSTETPVVTDKPGQSWTVLDQEDDNNVTLPLFLGLGNSIQIKLQSINMLRYMKIICMCAFFLEGGAGRPNIYVIYGSKFYYTAILASQWSKITITSGILHIFQ